MTEGEVVQTGTPQELFERPAHTFVGHFIGNPGMNFLPAAPSGTARPGWDSARCALPAGGARRASGGGPFTLGIRPEFVELQLAGRSRTAIPPSCCRCSRWARTPWWPARLEGQPLWAKLPAGGGAAWRPGPGWVRLPPEHLLVYADQRRVAPA